MTFLSVSSCQQVMQHDRGGRTVGTGVAYVQFDTPGEAERARDARNHATLGSRYIECITHLGPTPRGGGGGRNAAPGSNGQGGTRGSQVGSGGLGMGIGMGMGMGVGMGMGMGVVGQDLGAGHEDLDGHGASGHQVLTQHEYAQQQHILMQQQMMMQQQHYMMQQQQVCPQPYLECP